MPRQTTNVSEPPEALLLVGEVLSSAEANICTLLKFWGIRYQTLQIDGPSATDPKCSPKHRCILSSATRFAEILNKSTDSANTILGCAGSIYVYGFDGSDPCIRLLKELTGDDYSVVQHAGGEHMDIDITDDRPEMCGPMSGLQSKIRMLEGDNVFRVRANDKVKLIIRCAYGAIFVGVTYRSVSIYLSANSEIIDLNLRFAKRFDVRERFCCAVPVAMYINFALRPRVAETCACLVVDDPPLKPRYGFLRFRTLLALMDKYEFTTTIAFIPWNWKRTCRGVVRLFIQHPDRLSLSVHGCDHTASEMASQSTAVLNGLVQTAVERMTRLCERTSLRHDRVMVFPQGRFSPEAGSVLKLSGFMAAVNTEVAPIDVTRNETQLSDLWSVAIMKYGSFPIYTRRYLSDGLENFAFDGLLGKPCLIVGHHELFRDNALQEFVSELNTLRWNLRWRTLGEALVRSYSAFRSPDGTVSVGMFGSRLILENPTDGPRRMRVVRADESSELIARVVVNEEPVAWDRVNGGVSFEVTVRPRTAVEIEVQYAPGVDRPAGVYSHGVGWRCKTGVRRYLSEVRDNYISCSPYLSESLKRALRGLRLGNG
jgi:hypothetical protein